MKTIQIVMDEATLARLDSAARRGRMSRSAWIRKSVAHVLDAEQMRAMVDADRLAHIRQPPTRDEQTAKRSLQRSQTRVLSRPAKGDAW